MIELCPGKAKTIAIKTNDYEDFFFFPLWTALRPSTPTKRIRMKCELCSRRVLSSVTLDEDGDYIYHQIPPHKPKHWWKKKSKKRRKEKI